MVARGYEYADVVARKMRGHLKSLGFNLDRPPASLSIERKIDVLNYLRSVETAVDVIQHAVADTPCAEKRK